MNGLIRRKVTPLVILTSVLLAWFVLFHGAEAVVPPPDGGYPGGNTAEGQNALFSLTSGTFNTAVGFFSLRSNTIGSFNTAVGAGTLLANTADNNTATGTGALLSNTTGNQNTANGGFALFSNTDGGRNTAFGFQALSNNTGADNNTAMGAGALQMNTTGPFNTAVGDGALTSNTIGGDNTAIGGDALIFNSSGSGNVAVGNLALESNTTGGGNTAVGVEALDQATGGSNIAVGPAAGHQVTTASNVICIGHGGANVDNSCFISQIFGKPVGADALQVLVDSFGKLGTMSSSRRFKKEIKPMDEVSEAIFALKPVTFQYKTDATETPRFGLIAEEVAEVHPDLVVRDREGKPYSVRYDQVNAMLLNEFLKEHRKVEKLEASVADLAAQVRKLSAQVEMNNLAGQLAVIHR
jgi:hypothetical protein